MPRAVYCASAVSTRLALVAGETSGDLLAGLLLGGLRQVLPGLATEGIGGPHMQQQGFVARWPADKLAVRGYAEVLRHFPEIYAIRRRLGAQLLADPPAAFIGVDAPDFNLGLERRLRRAGIPVMHFVSPSIWAWRGERIDAIRQAVDHMLVLFPFEEAIYRDAGIAATYVGHPLADVIAESIDRSAARRALGLPEGPILAVLPGSRLDEIRYNAATFIAAGLRLSQSVAGLTMVVPMASAAARQQFLRCVPADCDATRLRLIDGQSHTVLAAADVGLIASGTATLEAALFKIPMVVAYRMAALTYHLMKDKGYLPWVALPNILAREFLVPEFLQHRATPEALARALHFQLSDDDNRAALVARFTDMHRALRRNMAARGAEVVRDFLGAYGALA